MSPAGAVAGALLTLAALDGSFSGFRSSAGRSGLIRHRRQDVIAAARGLLVVAVLLLPVVAAASLDVSAGQHGSARYVRAGQVMLAVYGPYAALVLVALACYTLLGWRHRFLATAVILGPFTLIRPLVADVGAGAGAWAAHQAVVACLAILAALAVLAVRPVADRIRHEPPQRKHAAQL